MLEEEGLRETDYFGLYYYTLCDIFDVMYYFLLGYYPHIIVTLQDPHELHGYCIPDNNL